MRRVNLRNIQIPWRRVAAIASILLVSYILLKFYIPRLLAFMISPPESSFLSLELEK
ncbi:MAG TPA: hypothetical protein IGS40_25290 [Trichormus sp. M33_DOE_039]|nr:hypothetical protein [Trichormus sp. M33_DOE_039]